MLFADMGAEVVRIERPGTRTAPHDILARGRSTLQVDLRAEGAAQSVLDAIEKADVLIEGFRPGVMERLGLGPAECHRAQPAAGLRPHDRLGPARPAARMRPATTSTTSPSAARCTPSAARASRRCRR